MTPIEPPPPPRKASWKRWALAVACVLVIAALALFLKAPASEPVSIWLVGSTNDNGVKKLVFEGTNGLPRRITYYALFDFSLANASQRSGFVLMDQDAATGEASAGETFTFSMDPPPRNGDWRMMWTYSDIDRALTPWTRLRSECAIFLGRHRMVTLARHVDPGPGMHYIPASEIKPSNAR